MYFFKKLDQTKLIVLVSIFFIAFDNVAFFRNVLAVYSISETTFLPLISVVILLLALLVLLFTLLSSKKTTKPILIIVLMISAFTSYYMNIFNVVINDDMIRNIVETNISEAADLFSFKLVGYAVLLGVLPSFLIYKAEIEYGTLRAEIFKKVKVSFICIMIILAMVFSSSKFYASFLREHKVLRFYANPAYWIYSTGNYLSGFKVSGQHNVKQIGLDIKIDETSKKSSLKDLVILVVGEAARSDRLALNGYERDINPALEKEEVVSFTNMYSCGTSTAISVPCMFSILNRDEFDVEKAAYIENILDVLSHTDKIKILWRDNNSSSKGVATNIEYQDFKSSETNVICDVECRDEGMLVGLNDYIASHQGDNILIILHQMGNHGPAYYKRYPKEFERFTPTCQTNQLEDCTREEINNAYDNAIFYTDYFLSETINFLKPYSKTHKTAMLYMSDHGESLGENGIFLHGLPYIMAPDNQKKVGSIVWLGSKRQDYDFEKLQSYKDKNFSHDNLFHSLLGLFGAKTEIYEKEKDIFKEASIGG